MTDPVVFYCALLPDRLHEYTIEEMAEKVRQGEAKRGNHLQFVSGRAEPEHNRYRLEFTPLEP